MKRFKYIQVYETWYATYVEAESLEQAREMIENGDYDHDDFFEDEEACLTKNIVQELDDDDDIVDDDEW